ncbi:MAG: CvpA family protein [Candidatus Omnitrophota bacterium]
MEWLWQLVDHLKKNMAGSALHSFSPLDWVILAAIFWGLIQGSRKGFSDMFGKLLGIFLVSMLTLSLYVFGAENLVMLTPLLPMKIAEPFSFVLWSICIWLIVSSAVAFFGRFLKLEAQGLFKTLGGMVLGVLRMMLLLSFFVQFLLFLPIKPLQNIFKPGRTYTGYTISRLVPGLHELVTGSIRNPTLKKSVASHKIGR